MESIEERIDKLLSQMILDEKLAQIGYYLYEESCSDTLILGGTVYPRMLGLASTHYADFDWFDYVGLDL
jgi:hypothetical protein